MLSPCCNVPIHTDACGRQLCSRCWWEVEPSRPKRDLIGWLFPLQSGPRPTGEPVFVRDGKRLELRNGQPRGKPDGWFWNTA